MGAGQSNAREVSVRRLAEGPGEGAVKVIAGEAGGARDGIERHPALDMTMQVFTADFDAAEEFLARPRPDCRNARDPHRNLAIELQELARKEQKVLLHAAG